MPFSRGSEGAWDFLHCLRRAGWECSNTPPSMTSMGCQGLPSTAESATDISSLVCPLCLANEPTKRAPSQCLPQNRQSDREPRRLEMPVMLTADYGELGGKKINHDSMVHTHAALQLLPMQSWGRGALTSLLLQNWSTALANRKTRREIGSSWIHAREMEGEGEKSTSSSDSHETATLGSHISTPFQPPHTHTRPSHFGTEKNRGQEWCKAILAGMGDCCWDGWGRRGSSPALQEQGRQKSWPWWRQDGKN